MLAYEKLVDPCEEFSPFNTRVHRISCDHVAGKATFAHVHKIVNADLSRQSRSRTALLPTNPVGKNEANGDHAHVQAEEGYS